MKMADLSDFKGGKIVWARVVGANVTKPAILFGVAISIVSKVMTTFEAEGKTPLKHSERKRKVFARDRRTLMQIFWKDHKNTAPKITADLNEYLENPAFQNV